MKTKVNYTIDEDIVSWINSQDTDSASEFVNSILVKAKSAENDYAQQILEIESQKSELDSQIEAKLNQLHKIIEEGNKKEREDAARAIKEAQEREKARLEKQRAQLESFSSAVKKFKLEKDLDACKTFQEVIDLLIKLSRLDERDEYTGCYSWAMPIYNFIVKPQQESNTQ